MSTTATANIPQETAAPLSVLDLPLHEKAALANRRSLPRVAGRFHVRLCENGDTFQGLDLSFGGLMCTGPEPLWPGNTFDFELVLPDETRPLRLNGRVAELVCHRGVVAMRVRFEGASEAARKRVAAWMSRSHGL